MELSPDTKRNLVITIGTILMTIVGVVPVATVAARYPVIPDPQRPLTWDYIASYRHPTDCLIVIEGKVYDITEYLGKHNFNPRGLAAFCGQDATAALTDQETRQIPAATRSLIATEFPQFGIVTGQAKAPVAH